MLRSYLRMNCVSNLERNQSESRPSIPRAHGAEFRKRRVGKGGVGASEAPASSTM